MSTSLAPMHVLLVHNYYRQAGGEDRVFETERSALLAHGHTVSELTATNDVLHGISMVTDSVWSAPARDRLSHLLEKKKPDIVHVHNIFFALSPSILGTARRYGIPTVQTLHNYRWLCPAGTFYRNGAVCETCKRRAVPHPSIVHRCCNGSLRQSAGVASILGIHRVLGNPRESVDLFVAPTSFARKKYVEGGFPEERIVVKAHFVSPGPYRSPDPGPALFVGRLSAEKGIGTLMQAWRELEGVPLDIVGDGPLEADMRSEIGSGRTSGIRVMGGKSPSDVRRLISTARFVIVPSECYETFGLVVIEAFSAGVPVICSGMGAVGELVADGENGLHFSTGDHRDLAAKVRWLSGNPNERDRMGEKAYDTYRTLYSEETGYRALMETYATARSVFAERHM